MDSRTSSSITSKTNRTLVIYLTAFIFVLLFIIHNLFDGLLKSWDFVYEDCFIKHKILYFKINNSLLTPFFEYFQTFTCESE